MRWRPRAVRVVFALLATSLLNGCEATRSFVSPAFRDDSWNLQTTAHFTIHVRPGSAAEIDLPQIGPYLESCLRTVTDDLGVRYDSRIQYLLYSSLDDKNAHALQGGTMTYSIPNLETIVGVYAGRDNYYGYGTHEITHVVAYWTLGVPTANALEEGLAVFVTGGYGGRRPHVGAAQYLKRGDIKGLAAMFDNETWNTSDQNSDFFYIVSGSLVEYLVERFGMERFKIFYGRASRDEYAQAISEIYGISADQLQADWLRGLESGELK